MIKRIGAKRDDKESAQTIYDEIMKQINVVNKTLLPYQRITKLTILDKPLEMTTTKKVKRNYNKK